MIFDINKLSLWKILQVKADSYFYPSLLSIHNNEINNVMYNGILTQELDHYMFNHKKPWKRSKPIDKTNIKELAILKEIIKTCHCPNFTKDYWLDNYEFYYYTSNKVIAYICDFIWTTWHFLLMVKIAWKGKHYR